MSRKIDDHKLRKSIQINIKVKSWNHKSHFIMCSHTVWVVCKVSKVTRVEYGIGYNMAKVYW